MIDETIREDIFMSRNDKKKIIIGLCTIMVLSFTRCDESKDITNVDSLDTTFKISNIKETSEGKAVDTDANNIIDLEEDTIPNKVPVEETENISEDLQYEFNIMHTYDTSGCDDYQIAYAAFLKGIWENDSKENNYEQTESYAIYDINKEGIPELLVKFGYDEAGYYTIVYSYVGGSVKEIGRFYSGHTGLYSWPSENGIMIFRGHMNNEYVTHATIVNEELIEEVISEKTVIDYSDVTDFIDGSTLINQIYTETVLPLFLLNTNQKPSGSVLFIENMEVKSAFKDVLCDRVSFYAYSLDGFGDASGLISMNNFLSAGSINSYVDDEYTILKYSFLDVNGDDQTELLLQLGTDGTMDVIAILSYDDGMVYCYYDIYADEYDFLQNGIIFSSKYIDVETQAIAFYKSEGYTYYIDGCCSDNILPVEWISIENLLEQ